QATLALALVYLEVLFALQYTQSNGLVTALMLLAFLALDEGRQLRAAGLVAVDAFIKIFPLGAAALAVFHPRRWRFALLLAAVALVLALLPLVVIPPHELLAQYRSWWTIEMADASRVNRGDSVMQYLYRWLGVDWPNWPVQLAGTLVLLAPLALEHRRWSDRGFRLRFLCSLLVYLVLFNHQSERASFVIAYTGLALWYALSEPAPVRNAIALAAAPALVLQDVEILPWSVHDALGRYRVKGIPCLVSWVVMQAELLGWRRWSPRSHGPEMRQADVSPPEPLASRCPRGRRQLRGARCHVAIPGHQRRIGMARVPHELRDPRPHPIDQGEHSGREATIVLERDAVEPVRMARRRDAVGRHAPRRPNAPAFDPDPAPPALDREAHEPHPVGTGDGHHRRPHARQR